MMSTHKHKILFFILILSYRFSLDYIYVYIIAPVWEYQHFYLNISQSSYFISIIWMLLLSRYDYKLYIDNRPSSNFFLFIDLLLFIPLSSIIPLSGMNIEFLAFSMGYWLILSSFQLKNIRRCYKGYDESGSVPSKFFLIISGVLVFANLIVTIYYNGFKIKLDLQDVYDIRFAVRDLHLPAIVVYLKKMASKVTLLLLMISIMNKKYIWVAILSIIQLMNFAFGALKGDLFTLLLVYIIAFFYNSSRRRFIILGLLAINILVIFEFLVTDMSLVSAIIHRRILYMPSLLSFEYFEFFSNHELVYLRDSFMRYFGFSSPYDLEVPRLIGLEYYGSHESNCNTGIIGDDYAQLGWLAIFIFPVLRVILFRILDNICENSINQTIVIFITSIFAITFISGTFFSSLLTGGFIGILILLFLYNKRCLPLNK